MFSNYNVTFQQKGQMKKMKKKKKMDHHRNFNTNTEFNQ